MTYFRPNDISQATAFLFLFEIFNLKNFPRSTFPSLSREIIRDMANAFPDIVSHVLARTPLQLELITCHRFEAGNSSENSMKILSKCCESSLKKHIQFPTEENLEEVTRIFAAISSDLFNLNDEIETNLNLKFNLKTHLYCAFLTAMKNALKSEDIRCRDFAHHNPEEIPLTFNLNSSWIELVSQVEEWVISQVEDQLENIQTDTAQRVLPIITLIMDIFNLNSSRFNLNFDNKPPPSVRPVGKYLAKINGIFLENSDLETMFMCLDFLVALSETVTRVKVPAEFFAKILALSLHGYAIARGKIFKLKLNFFRRRK